MHKKSGEEGQKAPNEDLKNFYMKVCVHKESLKTVSWDYVRQYSNHISKIVHYNFYRINLIMFVLLQNITDGHKLQLSFKVDALCNSHIRVNTCVTEKKNPNNAPEMFYTPNRDDYIQQISVESGMD